MNKKEITLIKETIEDLIKLRKQQYEEYIDNLIDKEIIAKTFGVSSTVFPRKKIDEYMPVDEDGDEDPFAPNKISQEQDTEKDIWSKFVCDFDIPLVNLNTLLKNEDRYEEVLEIEKEMLELNNKKIITVKEFTKKYRKSKTSQQNYRGRLYDPLPYAQIKFNGNITYKVDEVEKWFENQEKSGNL